VHERLAGGGPPDPECTRGAGGPGPPVTVTSRKKKTGERVRRRPAAARMDDPRGARRSRMPAGPAVFAETESLDAGSRREAKQELLREISTSAPGPNLRSGPMHHRSGNAPRDRFERSESWIIRRARERRVYPVLSTPPCRGRSGRPLYERPGTLDMGVVPWGRTRLDGSS